MLRFLKDSNLATLSELRRQVRSMGSALTSLLGQWFSPWRNYGDDTTLVGFIATHANIYYLTIGPMVFVQFDIEGVDDGVTTSRSFTLPYELRNIDDLEMRAVGHRLDGNGAYAHNTIVMTPGSDQVVLHHSDQNDPNGWPVPVLGQHVWGQFWYLR